MHARGSATSDMSHDVSTESRSGIRPLTARLATNRFDPLVDDGSRFPNKPGIYSICLRDAADPPPHCGQVTFTNFKRLRVLYVGIAGTEGTKRASLRARAYFNHFGGNAGGSTVRKSLGVLFGYKQIPRDRDPTTGKTKFSARDESALSNWMRTSLVVFFAQQSRPWEFEDALIARFNPPLNLDKNANPVNAGFRASLSALRRRK